MIYFVFAIIFSTLIIVTFRVMSIMKLNDIQSIMFNYFFAVLYGLFIWGEPFMLNAYTSKPWFELALIVGAFFIITFLLLSRSAVKVGVSITAVASRMSVLIPVMAGFIIFSDGISLIKVIGIMLAVFSFYLIFKPKDDIKVKWKNAILPSLLFLGIGTNDTMMKYIEFNFLNGDEALFLNLVFFIAFVLSLVIIIFRIFATKETFSAKSIFSGFILGSLNFGSTYFFIKSMSLFESSFLFPVFNVGVVVLTSFIGLIFFKEKLNKINWLGIGVALISLLLISNA